MLCLCVSLILFSCVKCLWLFIRFDGIYTLIRLTRSLFSHHFFILYRKWTTSHTWPSLISCLTFPRKERMLHTKSELTFFYIVMCAPFPARQTGLVLSGGNICYRSGTFQVKIDFLKKSGNFKFCQVALWSSKIMSPHFRKKRRGCLISSRGVGIL